MTELQKNIYIYLKEIDEICRKHGIEYYLAGGTLIGAIRHEGFLPWDDDADILMTRNNWEKFIRVYQEGGFPENRVLEGTEINTDYHNVFGRYVDTTKTAIHSNQLTDDEPAGMIVDVFAMDPVPSDPALQQRYLEDMALYSDLVNPNGQYSIRYEKNEKRYHTCRFLMKLGMKNAVLRYLQKRMFSYKEEECEYYALRWAGFGFFSRKEMYGKPKTARFVDTELMIPAHPEEYLTWHYGLDWALVPPHDERMSHDAVYDMDTDYKTMRKHFSKYVNRDKLRQANLDRKELRMKHVEEIHGKLDGDMELDKVMVLEEQKALLSSQKVDVRELLEQKQYLQLMKVFDSYITFATSRLMIGRKDFDGAFRYYKPIFSDIGIDNFEAIISAMTHTEGISRVPRFLEVFRINGGMMTKILQEMDDLAGEIHELYDLFWQGAFDSVRKRVEELLDRYPENQSLLRLEIQTLLNLKDETLYPLLQKWIRKARSLYPEDGELEKYEGDLAICEGNLLQGLLLYYRSSGHSINGMIALDIRNYLRNHIRETVKALEVPGVLEIADMEGFLNYICERGENHPNLMAVKYRLLARKAESLEDYVLLDSKMEQSTWSQTEEYETFRDRIFEKNSMNEDDRKARHLFKKAEKQDALEEYVGSLQERYGELSQTEHKLLGDAYVELHWIDKGFSEYHKVKNETTDPYLQVEIQYIFDRELDKIKSDFKLKRYPESVLIHGLEKRFGQMEDYDIILNSMKQV